MENERFIMTIYVFLFPHGLKDHGINIKDFNNLYKTPTACSFSPVIH